MYYTILGKKLALLAPQLFRQSVVQLGSLAPNKFTKPLKL